MSSVQTQSADAIARALAEPFDPRLLKCKPGVVQGTQALAFAYVDARVIADRLDAVMGVGGWQDDYEPLADGALLCRLRLRIGDEWVTRCGVGGASEQPDAGDRMKAAESDALKRAAVKFGIGRYLYRLPKWWLAFDPKRKQFTERPTLPAWAMPKPPALTAAGAVKALRSAEGDEAELCDESLAREIDALIRQHTKRKTWSATLAALHIDAPAEWAEPSDVTEAAAVCHWLLKNDAVRIRETIKSYIDKSR